MATFKTRLNALERLSTRPADTAFRRVLQPDHLTVAERNEWRSAQAVRPGRFIVRRPVPWPPTNEADVADLVEMGRSTADLLSRMRSMGHAAGEAAVLAFDSRQ